MAMKDTEQNKTKRERTERSKIPNTASIAGSSCSVICAILKPSIFTGRKTCSPIAPSVMFISARIFGCRLVSALLAAMRKYFS